MADNVTLLNKTLHEMHDIMKLSKCFICLKILQSPVYIKCKHSFCKACLIKKIKQRTNKCPRCKTSFCAEDFHSDHQNEALRTFTREIEKTLKDNFKEDIFGSFSKLEKINVTPSLKGGKGSSVPRQNTRKSNIQKGEKRKRSESPSTSTSESPDMLASKITRKKKGKSIELLTFNKNKKKNSDSVLKIKEMQLPSTSGSKKELFIPLINVTDNKTITPVSQNKNDTFDLLCSSQKEPNYAIKKPRITYSNTKNKENPEEDLQLEITNAILEFDMSKKKGVQKWVDNEKNLFDKNVFTPPSSSPLSTQALNEIENSLQSVSQANNKKYQSGVKQTKKNKGDYKGATYRRPRSLNVIEATRKSSRERHSTSTESVGLKNTETNTLSRLEEEFLNKIEMGFIKSPPISTSPKASTSKDMSYLLYDPSKKSVDSGWKRLAKMNKSISKQKGSVKQLRVKKITPEKSLKISPDKSLKTSLKKGLKISPKDRLKISPKRVSKITDDTSTLAKQYKVVDLESFFQSNIDKVEIKETSLSSSGQLNEVLENGKENKIGSGNKTNCDNNTSTKGSINNLKMNGKELVNYDVKTSETNKSGNENVNAEDLNLNKTNCNTLINEEIKEAPVISNDKHEQIAHGSNNQILSDHNKVIQLANCKVATTHTNSLNVTTVNLPKNTRSSKSPNNLEMVISSDTDDEIFNKPTQKYFLNNENSSKEATKTINSEDNTSQNMINTDKNDDTLDTYISTFTDIFDHLLLLAGENDETEQNNIRLYQIRQIEAIKPLIEKLKNPQIQNQYIDEQENKTDKGKSNVTDFTSQSFPNNFCKVPEVDTKIGNKNSVYELSTSFDELEFETQDVLFGCLNKKEKKSNVVTTATECTITQIIDDLNNDVSKSPLNTSWVRRTPNKRFKSDSTTLNTSEIRNENTTNQSKVLSKSDLPNTTSSYEKCVNNSAVGIPDVIEVIEDNSRDNENFIKSISSITSFNEQQFNKNTTNFENNVQSLIKTVLSVENNTSMLSNQGSGKKTSQGSDFVISLPKDKDICQKLEYDEPQINSKQPKKSRMVDVSVCFDTQTAEENLDEISMGSSDVGTEYLEQAMDRFDNGDFGKPKMTAINKLNPKSTGELIDISDNFASKYSANSQEEDTPIPAYQRQGPRPSQEVIQSSGKALKDITSKYNQTVESQQEETSIPAYQRAKSTQSYNKLDNENISNSNSFDIIQRLINKNDSDLRSLTFSGNQKQNERLLVESSKSEQHKRSTLDKYIDEFNLDDDDDEMAMALIHTDDILKEEHKIDDNIKRSPKVTIALQEKVTYPKHQDNPHTDDEFFSDSDIIESTPENSPTKSKKDADETYFDCFPIEKEGIPPPPEFQDKINNLETGNNLEATPINKLASGKRRSFLDIDNNGESENHLHSTTVLKNPSNTSLNSEILTLSPISRMISQESLVIGTPKVPVWNKKCSTPRPTKQLSIRKYMINKSAGKNLFKATSGDKPCIASTRMNSEQMVAISALADKKLATYSKEYSPSVTHMIVPVDEQNLITDLTIKFISGVAAGIWVLRFEWVQKCLAENKIVPEGPYEVFDSPGKSGPKESRLYRKVKPLFKNCRVYAAPPLSSAKTTEVENVIKMLGGTTVSSPEGFLIHVEDAINVIIAEGDTEYTDQYDEWLDQLKVITVDIEWLGTSVAQYKLQSLYRFALCSNDTLSTLPYPRELVEPYLFTFTEN